MAKTRTSQSDGRPVFTGHDTARYMRAGWMRLPTGFDLSKSFLLAADASRACLIAYPRVNDEFVYPYIISPPDHVHLDPYRKFKISEELAKEAQLVRGQSVAVLAGVGRSIEIWREDNWRRHYTPDG